MNIRTCKTLVDDVYKVSIYSQDWGLTDTALMAKFGEPEINIGGSFTDPVFTLTDHMVKIKTDSPFEFSCDINTYADAKERANRWATDIKTRLTTAITTLRTNNDDYSGETTVTV